MVRSSEEPRAWHVGLSPGMGETDVQGPYETREGGELGSFPTFHICHLAICYPCSALPQNNWVWKRFCLVPRWNQSGVSRNFLSFLKNTSHPQQASTNSKRRSCPRNTSSPRYPQESQQHPPILIRLKKAKKKGIYLKQFLSRAKESSILQIISRSLSFTAASPQLHLLLSPSQFLHQYYCSLSLCFWASPINLLATNLIK